MKRFYSKDEFELKFTDLEKLDKSSDDYFLKYMKIILSFGRESRVSEYGFTEGKRLYERWKNGEELTREEIILLGYLLTDICVMEENKEMLKDLNSVYNQMVTKYKPDFQYLQDFARNHMLNSGYIESNPNYMQTVEQMFTTDYVIPDPEQMRMINTGEMPIYDKVKVCPYCGTQFPDDGVEDLFKHVKSEHNKK